MCRDVGVLENGNTNVSDEHVASIFRVGVISGRMWTAQMCRIAADVVRQKRGTETHSGRQRWRHMTPKRCYHFQHYGVSQLEAPPSDCKPPLQLLMLSPGFFLWRCGPTRDMAFSFTRVLDHTHNDASQSVRPLWTRDQCVAETSI